MLKKYIIGGCLVGASFFVGCSQQPEQEENTSTTEESEPSEPEMYEASELAALMRQMYEDNLKLGEEINAGNIPESFPEDFKTIHTAVATPGMKTDTAYFNLMAEQYLRNLEKITQANSRREAKIAYNEMVLTCASCHQKYCQGPLPKIRRMKLPIDEPKSATD